MNKWISVKNHLPPQKVLVRTYTPNPYPFTEWDISGKPEAFSIELFKQDRHYFNNWIENGVWACVGYGEVSHWQELDVPE